MQSVSRPGDLAGSGERKVYGAERSFHLRMGLSWAAGIISCRLSRYNAAEGYAVYNPYYPSVRRFFTELFMQIASKCGYLLFC